MCCTATRGQFDNTERYQYWAGTPSDPEVLKRFFVSMPVSSGLFSSLSHLFTLYLFSLYLLQDRYIDGWMDRSIDRWMDGWMDKCVCV